MASILDDLRSVLGDEAIAKLEANGQLKTRLQRGEEFRSYYDDGEPPAVQDPPPAAGDPPPAAPKTPPSLDLGAIDRMLDAKLKKVLDSQVEAKIGEVVKTKGDELYTNVRAGVRNDALQLVKMYTRHQEVTGTPWTDEEETKFNEFLVQNNEAMKTGGGKAYKSLTEAYNDYIAPTVEERRVDAKVKERLAAESGNNVPGSTPAPASNSNIRAFMKRGAAGDPNATTGAGRAAAALDRILANRNQMAS